MYLILSALTSSPISLVAATTKNLECRRLFEYVAGSRFILYLYN